MGTWAWFKVETEGWLQGSIRMDLSPEQRGVWIDLLALASDTRVRDGTLRFAPGKPMPREWIANTLRITVELLNSTLDACTNDKNKEDEKHRIEIWDDGTIELSNFAKYQSIPEGKRKKMETQVQLDLRHAREAATAAINYPLIVKRVLEEEEIKEKERRKRWEQEHPRVDTETGEIKEDGE